MLEAVIREGNGKIKNLEPGKGQELNQGPS